MNHDRFIELLNLYLDHQLSPAEAAELEAEVRRDPARRKTYDEYCRMQAACVQLFEQERAKAPSSSRLSAALRSADRKLAAHPTRSRSFWANPFVQLGGLAAAACLAVVLVRNQSAPANSAQTTLAANQPSVSAPTTESQTSAHPAPASLASASIASTASPDAIRPAETKLAAPTRSLANDFVWTSTTTDFAPIQKLPASEFRFTTLSSENATTSPLLHTAPAAEEAAEMTAFRFQK